MTAEQLNLLDLTPTLLAPVRRTRAVAPVATAVAESGVVVIESRYPAALAFMREHGPDVMAVLHVLAVESDAVDGRLVVRASTRGLAGRLGFLSKDSVHRRLRQLRRAGVLELLPPAGPTEVPVYVLHLDGTGLAVSRNG